MKEWRHVFEPTFEQCLGQNLVLDWLWPQPWDFTRELLLELACGYGIYALGLARAHPEALVVGVDLKGSRLWHGAEQAQKEGLLNLHFLRTHIESIDVFFPPHSVDELWITFPDPHPTKGNAKRRLTSGRFLELYRKILKPGAKLHLKTDDLPLFLYSLQTALAQGFILEERVDDVHGTLPNGHFLKVLRTHYEQKHLQKGKTIYYARWRYEF